MTPAQKKALAKFAADRGSLPSAVGVRTDVASVLFESGYLRTLVGGKSFRAGWAPLFLTDKGREALTTETDR